MITQPYLPNPTLTPGAVLTRSVKDVCTPGWASAHRDVSDAEKRAVFARYRVRYVRGRFEVDHLISLELGGSNALTNLFPEPYAGPWGAHTKDKLETRLHSLVCKGQVSLAVAQQAIARNWPAAMRRYASDLIHSGRSQ